MDRISSRIAQAPSALGSEVEDDPGLHDPGLHDADTATTTNGPSSSDAGAEELVIASDAPGDGGDAPAAPPPRADGTLMSLTRAADGVRFVYNGVMEQWRVEALDEVLSMNLRPFTGLDRFSAETLAGRDRRLVRCELVIDDALAPRVVSVLGRSRPRTRWWSGLLSRA